MNIVCLLAKFIKGLLYGGIQQFFFCKINKGEGYETLERNCKTIFGM